MKDISNIKDRLSSLRKERFKLYKEYQDQKDNPYTKYSCCKTKMSLAEKMNLDRRTIGKWESGQAIPSLDNLVELSKILDCTVDYFLGEHEFPATPPVQTASYFSGISPEIIAYGLGHPDYLDCLNFFMLPENCSTLFNDITLKAWKKHWIDSELSDIKNPLKKRIIEIFNEFNAVTPFTKNTKNSYKNYLKTRLLQSSLSLSDKNSTGLNLKATLNEQNYKNFITLDKELSYQEFINYLADYTYDPLMQNAILELQKLNLSQAFISLFTKYISDNN